MKTKTVGLIAALFYVYSSAVSAGNLIVNGDFSLVTTGSGMGNFNNGIPTSWGGGITGQIDNATVVNGAMLFSTAGAHNPNQHKYYINQVFNASEDGIYTLSFDYRLQNGRNGYITNGAKVVIDQWYSSAPNAVPVFSPNVVFSATYGKDYSDLWHTGQTVALDLTAGNHTLYLGTFGPSRVGDQAAVLYDNVSITKLVSSVPEPETYAMFLAGLGLLGAAARRRQQK